MDAIQLLSQVISIVLHHLFHLNPNLLYLKTSKLICRCLCRSSPNHWLKMDPREYVHLNPQNLWASLYMAGQQASSRRERGRNREGPRCTGMAGRVVVFAKVILGFGDEVIFYFIWVVYVEEHASVKGEVEENFKAQQESSVNKETKT